MSHHFKIMKTLREEGVRLTPQRLLVLEIICDAPGHLSAEDIYNQVRERYPYVDLSTIYRTLDFLKEHGIISETDLGHGRLVFEQSSEHPHHHLVCRRCGATEVLEADVLEPLARSLMDTYGFQADFEHLAIFGLCPGCLAAEDDAGSGGDENDDHR